VKNHTQSCRHKETEGKYPRPGKGPIERSTQFQNGRKAEIKENDEAKERKTEKGMARRQKASILNHISRRSDGQKHHSKAREEKNKRGNKKGKKSSHRN
jgi:hypothetical protein